MTKISLLILLMGIAASCKLQTPTPKLNQKIAQMVMVGFRGAELSDTNHIINDIKKFKIGGVILYEYDSPTKSRPRNISSATQLQQLNKTLQSYASIPLFIGIDEEGGRVSRLKAKYGFPQTVSPKYLGHLNNDDTTLFYARNIAQQCIRNGINLNFAPVVDLDINQDCPVIGKLERSFSANADTVSHLAQLFIQQHEQVGVFCSIKHFPGHGSAKTDSHLGFTDVSNTWTSQELAPYKQLLADSSIAPMIMTAHVFNSKLDSVYPATLSKNTLSILRNSLHFNGLILSDDMMMHAISEHYGLEEAIEKAINAGVDMLLFSNNIDIYDNKIAEKVITIIHQLVASHKISEERIDESYQRIVKAKSKIK